MKVNKYGSFFIQTWFLDDELKSFAEVNLLTEEALKKARDKFFNELNKKESTFPKDELGDFYDFFADDIERHETIFMRLHRNSIFISLMAFAEIEANLICRILQKRGKHLLRVKDIQGKGLHRAALYLKKVVGLKSSFNIDAWPKLLFYQELRNAIVHVNNILSEKTLALAKSYETSNGFLSIKNNERIIINEGFINEVISNQKIFFHTLMKELSRKGN